MSATNDSGYQFTKIGADAERAAKRAAEDNLPVDMMNDRRMQSYAGLWAIIGAKAAATVVLAEARAQFEQDIADAERRAAERATAETIMGGQRYAVVWALRRAAEGWRANATPGDEDDFDAVVARQLDARADRIQAGGDR